MIFVMSISMLCVPAMAAEEASFSPPDDELICEMCRFISDLVDLFGSDFAANHYDKLKVGDAIPTYSLDQGSDSIHLFVMDPGRFDGCQYINLQPHSVPPVWRDV